MTRQMIGRAILAVVFGGAASAASGQIARSPAPVPPPHGPLHGILEFVGVEMGDVAVVRGAPFSAEAVTTVAQTLGDGTRIDRRVTAKIYRDSEGRVRREQTVLGLNALSGSADPQTIVTISDPVAGVTYMLDAGSRTARRLPLARGHGPQSPHRPPPPPPPPPPGERPAVRPANVPNWPEPLGTRQIEGVTAVGTKRTETIPAGRIGNDRPIVVTDERWESPDLKMLLLSQHHDPRTGDVEYKLTNISRAEPAQHLFTVPADYEMVDVKPPPQ